MQDFGRFATALPGPIVSSDVEKLATGSVASNFLRLCSIFLLTRRVIVKSTVIQELNYYPSLCPLKVKPGGNLDGLMPSQRQRDLGAPWITALEASDARGSMQQ